VDSSEEGGKGKGGSDSFSFLAVRGEAREPSGEREEEGAMAGSSLFCFPGWRREIGEKRKRKNGFVCFYWRFWGGETKGNFGGGGGRGWCRNGGVAAIMFS